MPDGISVLCTVQLIIFYVLVLYVFLGTFFAFEDTRIRIFATFLMVIYVSSLPFIPIFHGILDKNVRYIYKILGL